MTTTKTRVRRCFPWFLMAMAAFAAPLATPEMGTAVPITVPNFSFEGSSGGDTSFDPAPIPDWSITGTFSGAGSYNSNDALYSGTSLGSGDTLPPPGDGIRFGLANVNRSAIPGTNSAVFTSAASLGTVQDNMLYSLTVAVGNRAATNSNPDSITIEFLVDDIVVPASSLTVLGSVILDDSFLDFTTSFTTFIEGDPLTGGDLKVRFTHSSLAGTGAAAADFDNIRVDVTELPFVPEPSTFTLGILGLAAMTRLGRRRHNKRRLSHRRVPAMHQLTNR